MTEIQSMMLAVCFGAVVGTFVAELITIVKYTIKDHKEKKSKRKEAENKQ